MSVYPRKVPNNKKRIFLFRNNRAFPFHLIRRWNYVLSRLIKYSIFKNNRFFHVRAFYSFRHYSSRINTQLHGANTDCQTKVPSEFTFTICLSVFQAARFR